MFDLVADVERYPEFLPWCVALRVVGRDGDENTGVLLADMIVAYKVFREQFRSEVRLNRPENKIDAHYIDGPFRNLETHWQFTDLPTGGSRIDFEISFMFRNVVMHTTALMVFEKAFSRMSEAFVDRAKALHTS